MEKHFNLASILIHSHVIVQTLQTIGYLIQPRPAQLIWAESGYSLYIRTQVLGFVVETLRTALTPRIAGPRLGMTVT
jgi:hypothetical protein